MSAATLRDPDGHGRPGLRGRRRYTTVLVALLVGSAVARRVVASRSAVLGAVDVVIGVVTLVVLTAALVTKALRGVAEAVRDGRRLLGARGGGAR